MHPIHKKHKCALDFKDEMCYNVGVNMKRKIITTLTVDINGLIFVTKTGDRRGTIRTLTYIAASDGVDIK